MELLFRNALANDPLYQSFGALIKRIAMSNKMARDSLVRVTRRFTKAVLTSPKVTLIRDQEAAEVTTAQFMWILRMDMLRLEKFVISSTNSNDCNRLSKAPHMPTLRELKCSAAYWAEETWSRSSYKLATALIENNKKTLKILDGLPILMFNEALPALELDTFVFTPNGRFFDSEASLTHLDSCSMDVFKYDASEVGTSGCEISLEPLANIDANEIFFKFVDFEGFKEPTRSATNNHVRTICIEAEQLRLYHDLTDIVRLLRFFPKLETLDICANNQIPSYYSMYASDNWRTLSNIKHRSAQILGARPLQVKLHAVLRIYERENIEWTRQNMEEPIQDLRDRFDGSLPEGIEGLGNVYATFHRVSVSDTKEADEKAAELGLHPERVNEAILYKGRIDFTPDASANVEYTVL
ncbi:hypothetical protein AAVH_09182 [Aphelenchoides avenae]|nr:hypothetical protein AAVH_09182 [Aphelenchus avenae]